MTEQETRDLMIALRRFMLEVVAIAERAPGRAKAFCDLAVFVGAWIENRYGLRSKNAPPRPTGLTH